MFYVHSHTRYTSPFLLRCHKYITDGHSLQVKFLERIFLHPKSAKDTNDVMVGRRSPSAPPNNAMRQGTPTRIRLPPSRIRLRRPRRWTGRPHRVKIPIFVFFVVKTPSPARRVALQRQARIRRLTATELTEQETNPQNPVNPLKKNFVLFGYFGC